jgi:hypothetical protein
VKFCAQYALSECADDLAYFEEEYPDGIISRINNYISRFKQMKFYLNN